jgi:O-antigen/teichoic acid export membrane protein
MSSASSPTEVGAPGAPANRKPRGLLGGGAVVGAGLAVELGSQFVRTLILARLLGANEFGLVASINTLYAVVEMVSFIGIDRYLVYAPEGALRHALDVAHTLSWLRACISSALIFALAGPTAALVGASEYANGFAVVAIVPLLRGATHLGVTQMQRSGRFVPSAAAEAIGAVLGLLAAAAAALTTHDYRAVLWGLGVQAGAAVLASHLFARGIPYRLSADRRIIRDALRFGMPLLLNGLALAAAFQLDRMVIGAWLGVAELGIYGLTMTLFLQPISLLMRLANTALQPRLSAAWHADRPGEFQVLAWQLGRYGAAVGGAGAAAAACLGAPFLQHVFGPSYSASDTFLVLLAGGGVLMRLCRGALNLLGLAIGRTPDLMISNIAGSAMLPMTVAAFYVYPRIESAAFAGLVGELLTCFVAMSLLRKHCGEAAVTVLRSFVVAGMIPAVLGIGVLVADPSILVRAIAAVAGFIAALLVLLFNRHPPCSDRLALT